MRAPPVIVSVPLWQLAEDHGLVVDAETLRRWMLEADLWTRAARLFTAHGG